MFYNAAAELVLQVSTPLLHILHTAVHTAHCGTVSPHMLVLNKTISLQENIKGFLASPWSSYMQLPRKELCEILINPTIQLYYKFSHPLPFKELSLNTKKNTLLLRGSSTLCN